MNRRHGLHVQRKASNHETDRLSLIPLFVVMALSVLSVSGPDALGQTRAEAVRALDKNGDGAISKEEAGEVTEKSRTRGPFEKIFPLTYATKKQPPCVMFFGTADRLLAGAEAFREKSVDAGNDCEIMTWEGQGHGFFNHGKADGKYFNLTVAEADQFLIDLGWLQPKAD